MYTYHYTYQHTIRIIKFYQKIFGVNVFIPDLCKELNTNPNNLTIGMLTQYKQIIVNKNSFFDLHHLCLLLHKTWLFKIIVSSLQRRVNLPIIMRTFNWRQTFFFLPSYHLTMSSFRLLLFHYLLWMFIKLKWRICV